MKFSTYSLEALILQF